MRISSVFFGFALTALTLGCSDPAGPPRIEDTQFAPELGIDLSAMTKTASGLYVQDLTVGSGESVEASDFVRIYYTGWLANGTQFDAAQPPDKQPFRFFVGVGGVIRGFAEGTLGMREGGRRRIIIPPHLGYGGSPQDGIPGNSILVFVIDLVEIE